MFAAKLPALIRYFTLKPYQFAAIVKAKESTNQPCHIIMM